MSADQVSENLHHMSWGLTDTRCGAKGYGSRNFAAVTCPDCLALVEWVGEPTPIPGCQRPPQMGTEFDDGVFIFYDIHHEQSEMEVVPQISGNVEITIGDTLFTLSHLDRMDLVRALLHDFHYSPEQDGPHEHND